MVVLLFDRNNGSQGLAGRMCSKPFFFFFFLMVGNQNGNWQPTTEQLTTQCSIWDARLATQARGRALSRVYGELISRLASCKCCGASYAVEVEAVGVANYMNSKLKNKWTDKICCCIQVLAVTVGTLDHFCFVFYNLLLLFLFLCSNSESFKSQH